MRVQALRPQLIASRAGIAVWFVVIATTSHHAQSAAYFSPTDSMAAARTSASAVPLADGTVLVLGDSLSSAYSEVYEPSSGRFALAGALGESRTDAAAIGLADGRVLVVGGWNGTAALSSIELYDPAARAFSSAGHLLLPRVRPAIARLGDGRVLVAGGHDGASAYSSAEVYDPESGVSVAANDMSTARVGTATALQNGDVLVLGGGSTDNPSAMAELYDPLTDRFSATGALNIPRSHQATTLLADGRVLVTGGLDAAGNPIAQAELYDPSDGAFHLTGRMIGARSDQGAVLLSDGSVLAVGGQDSSGVLVTAELYDPATGTFCRDASLLEPRATPIVTALPDGGALVAGGGGVTREALATAERYGHVRRSETSTFLSSSLAWSTFGQAVTYRATVASRSGTPSGEVQFFDGTALLGQAQLNAAGLAALTISTTPAGTRAISAVYAGSAAFNRSESPATRQVVAQASAIGSFTITPVQRQYSDPVTFTVTVSPADAAQSVTFKAGTLVLGNADVKAGRATLTMPVPANMPFGSRIVTAAFNQSTPNYAIASVWKSMSTGREDARVIGYGSAVYTACSTCTTATVHLEATVQDISVTPDANGDMTPGDIRNATVTFVNRATYATIATVPVTLTDRQVLTEGEAVYEWTVDLGAASSKTFKIGYAVGGLYTRTSYDYYTVTVSKPK